MPGVTSAIGALVAYIASSITVAGVVKAVIAVGLTVLSQSLRKKPSSSGVRAQSQTMMVRQSAYPRRIIYGESRVGIIWLYLNTTGSKNDFLHLVGGICEGPIESIDEVWFGDTVISLDANGNATGKYSGYLSVNKHLGPTPQTADADLVDADSNWTSAHRLDGIAYVYLKLKHSTKVFEAGLPEISVKVSGNNSIFDPRGGGSTGYSNNSALCANHYLTTARTGPGAVYADEVDEPFLITAANICDESVALKAGGTENRYETNGIVSLDDNPEDILAGLTQAMAGWSVYVAGRFRFYAGKYVTPTFTITEDMIVGVIETNFRVPKRERANIVKGVFISEANNWQPSDFPPRVDSAAKTADGEELSRDIDLDYTISNSMAQRIAERELKEARLETRMLLECNLRAFPAQSGENVMVTIGRYSFDEKHFHVQETSLSIRDGTPTVKLSLKEASATVDDWDESTDEIEANDPADISVDRPDIDLTLTPEPPGPERKVAEFFAADDMSMSLADHVDFDFTSDFTVAMWLKFSGTAQEVGAGIFGQKDSVEFFAEDGVDRLTVKVTDDSTNVYTLGDAAATAPTDQYVLVVLRVNGTALDLWIKSEDGLYTVTDSDTLLDIIANSASSLVLGGVTSLALKDRSGNILMTRGGEELQIRDISDNTGFFDGTIASLGYWNKSFSNTERDDYFDAGVQLHENLSATDLTSLVAYWNLNEHTGNRIDSQSAHAFVEDNPVPATVGPSGEYPVLVTVSDIPEEVEVYYADAPEKLFGRNTAALEATPYSGPVSVNQGSGFFVRGFDQNDPEISSPIYGGYYGFDPEADISSATLELHLDAECGIIASSLVLEEWKDQSSNNNHAVQATAGERPSYVANQFNGYPVIRFDGSDDNLTAPQVIDGITARDIFVVAMSPNTVASADDTENHLLDLQDGATPVAGAVFSIVFRYHTRLMINGGEEGHNTSLNASQYYIMHWRWFDNPLADNDTDAWQDGDEKANRSGGVAGTVDTATTTNMVIGKSNWEAGSEFEGDIVKLMIFSGGLSVADRKKITHWLQGQYGLFEQ